MIDFATQDTQRLLCGQRRACVSRGPGTRSSPHGLSAKIPGFDKLLYAKRNGALFLAAIDGASAPHCGSYSPPHGSGDADPFLSLASSKHLQQQRTLSLRTFLIMNRSQLAAPMSSLGTILAWLLSK